MAEHGPPEAICVTKTNQEIADRVNESLPIHITVYDVDKYPELIKLLTAVSQHVKEDGLTTSTKHDLAEAEQNLKHEKYKWLQQHILYHELQELMLDHDLKSLESPATPAHKQYYAALKQCLSLAEIGNYLDCSPDPGVGITLLGLKKEDIERQNPNNKHMQAIQQNLIPEIEARLRRKCETLVSFYESNSSMQDSKFNFSKVSQLPEQLEARTLQLEEEKRQLKRDRYNREKQFWQYYKVLIQSLEVLEKLILNHRLSAQKDTDKITSEWLTSRCEAMCLKIKLQEVKLMCDTYYTETVQALTRIRKHLDGAISDTSQELSQVTEALKAYEAIGLGFDPLVHEYTELRDEIDNKKWALRELVSTLDTGDDVLPS